MSGSNGSSASINLRLPHRLLIRLKELAREADKGYQTLIREVLEAHVAVEAPPIEAPPIEAPPNTKTPTLAEPERLLAPVDVIVPSPSEQPAEPLTSLTGYLDPDFSSARTTPIPLDDFIANMEF